jgi:NAD+ synthase
MKITLAQLNFTVGDFETNTSKIIDAAKKNQSADLIVFPELCICGYPPEDLVLRPEFINTAIKYTKKIIEYSKRSKADLIINTPWIEEEGLYNAALLVSRGKILHKQFKYDLPNYGVFDEKRLFKAGALPKPFKYKNKKIGILICEDTWNKKAVNSMKGAAFVISVNASPFETQKYKKRQKILNDAAKIIKAPVFYVNQVTGHDDLVFDGGSMVFAANGNCYEQMNFFTEQVKSFDLNKVLKAKPKTQFKVDDLEHIYSAMCYGLKEYVTKNGFPGVVIGLSGGMDSAITACVAADALGKDKVKLVLLPSEFTSKESFDDAKDLSKNLGIALENISIQPLFKEFIKALQPSFKGKKPNIAEENIQARIRGVLLMAISNKHGHLVVTTGNKSEMATGYATLYGDMCGGYNVVKDLYKTKVYEVSKWRNANIPDDAKINKKNIIPANIIKKAPTAELRHNQKDQDTLPPYDVLDEILYNLIELQKSAEDVVKLGFSKAIVNRVERMLYTSEHKRRQAAPGVKISSKPFSRDRRYPITNKFLEY